jgi:hypothetical protein
MSIQRLLISCLLAVTVLSAYAFDRPFPQNAKRGVLKLGAYPNITINDKAYRLSAGSRIWNQGNLIQMPSSLTDDKYLVNYTQDMQGEVDRVWILTDVEAKMPPPKATPPVTTLPSPS